VLEKFEISLDQKNRRVRLQRKEDSPIGPVSLAPGADAKFPATPSGAESRRTSRPSIPATTRKMKAFFEANCSAESLRKRSIADRLRVYGEMREVNKRFRIERVAEDADGTMTVLAENAAGEWREFGFRGENGPSDVSRE